jgi:hypothetical protein
MESKYTNEFMISNPDKDDISIFVQKLEARGWKQTENLKTKPTLLYIIRSANNFNEKKYYPVYSLITNQLGGAKSSLTNKFFLCSTLNKISESLADQYLMKSFNSSLFDPNTNYSYPYILKGIGAFAGKGNEVVGDLEEMKFKLKELKKRFTTVMICEYIRDPLLIYNRKFHLRVSFVVVRTKDYYFTSVLPCYNMAISKDPFKLEDFENTSIHDTHFSTTYENEIFQFLDPNKFPKFTMTLVKNVENQINTILKVLSPSLENTVELYDNCLNGFDILGADFMITNDGNIKLLEINEKASYIRLKNKTAYDLFYSNYFSWIDSTILENILKPELIEKDKNILYFKKF